MARRRRPGGLMVLLLACLVSFPGKAEEPPPTVPNAVASHSAWIGTWILDKEASDSVERVLDVMDLSWYVRVAARTFTPRFEVAAEGRGFAWTSRTPLGTRTQHFRADDREYTGQDQLDRKFVQKSAWAPDGHLLVDRTTTLPTGEKVTVHSNWSVEASKLVNRMNVKTESGESFRLERVFVRGKS